MPHEDRQREVPRGDDDGHAARLVEVRVRPRRARRGAAGSARRSISRRVVLAEVDRLGDVGVGLAPRLAASRRPPTRPARTAAGGTCSAAAEQVLGALLRPACRATPGRPPSPRRSPARACSGVASAHRPTTSRAVRRVDASRSSAGVATALAVDDERDTCWPSCVARPRPAPSRIAARSSSRLKSVSGSLRNGGRARGAGRAAAVRLRSSVRRWPDLASGFISSCSSGTSLGEARPAGTTRSTCSPAAGGPGTPCPAAARRRACRRARAGPSDRSASLIGSAMP